MLILKDGTEFETTSNSIVDEVMIRVPDMDSFLNVYKTLSEENLSNFTFNGTAYQNRVVMETKTYKMQNDIECHFILLPTEIQRLIDEARASAVTPDVADKAEAYDILVGGE